MPWKSPVSSASARRRNASRPNFDTAAPAPRTTIRTGRLSGSINDSGRLRQHHRSLPFFILSDTQPRPSGLPLFSHPDAAPLDGTIIGLPPTLSRRVLHANHCHGNVLCSVPVCRVRGMLQPRSSACGLLAVTSFSVFSVCSVVLPNLGALGFLGTLLIFLLRPSRASLFRCILFKSGMILPGDYGGKWPGKGKGLTKGLHIQE
jgi:hypothetical protein